MKTIALQLDDARLPDGYRIREAVSADLQAIHLVEHAGQQAPWSESVLEKELGLERSSIWVVEDSDGFLCAYLCYWIVIDEVHILNVVVHPRARRRGLASALVDELIRAAEQARLTVITLEVRRGNTGARNLYERAGFKEIGLRKAYYSDNGEDAVVMARIIEERP